MKMRLQNFLEKYPAATLPLVLFFIYALVVSGWKLLGAERYDLIILQLKNLVSQYGLWALVLGSVIETLFMVGAYLPGSLVIVISVALFSRDPVSLFMAFVCINAAAFVTNILNYYIGSTGMYKFFKYLGAQKAINNAKKQMELYGGWSIFLSGVHPNLLGIMVAYAGLSGRGLLRTLFASLLTTIVWVPLLMWTSIIFTDQLLNGRNGSWLAMPFFFVVWILVVVLVVEYRNKFKVQS
jgi:membrane protein DedA with SNARE-associated domain